MDSIIQRRKRMKYRFYSILFVLIILIFPYTLVHAEIQVGNSVFLGKYEQDNDLNNGKEDIEWIVLDSWDNQLLLLSKYCLETVIFYPKRVPMYWGKSDLRQWMNGEFFHTTFSLEEQSIILLHSNTNSNPHAMSGAGTLTEDFVFLLSKDEVLKYFPLQEDRVAYPSEYAKSKDITLDPKTGSCRWWTRTSGARNLDMWGIRLDGRMTAYGMQDVDWPGNMMRPAIVIDGNKLP